MAVRRWAQSSKKGSTQKVLPLSQDVTKLIYIVCILLNTNIGCKALHIFFSPFVFDAKSIAGLQFATLSSAFLGPLDLCCVTTVMVLCTGSRDVNIYRDTAGVVRDVEDTEGNARLQRVPWEGERELKMWRDGGISRADAGPASAALEHDIMSN